MAKSDQFETWLCDKLAQFNADADVFSTYILGILDSEETPEEKETNLADLLEGLGLDDGSPDPCQRLQAEIFTHWSKRKSSSSCEEAEQSSRKDQAQGATLGKALAAHAESQTQAYVASR